MPPAEIFQGGHAILHIEKQVSHKSMLRGVVVIVTDADDGKGCCIRLEDNTIFETMPQGSSQALDSGEIVRSS